MPLKGLFPLNWTRRELKTRGLAAFKANYWPCVAVALIACFVAGNGCRFSYNVSGDRPSSSPSAITVPEAPREADAAGEAGSGISPFRDLWNNVGAFTDGHPRLFVVCLAVLAVAAVVAIVAIASLVRFLLLNPLSVGCSNFFLRNTVANAPFGAIGAPFRDWKRVAWMMFLRDLFLFAWFLPALAAWFIAAGAFLHAGFPLGDEELTPMGVFFAWLAAAALLAIPAIVKTYAYRLVPYLLSDDPALSGRAAVTRSRALMAGNKRKAFLLDLSFLGWHLLSLLTLGLLWVFRVLPWVQATDAELYRALVPRPVPVPPPLPGAAAE